MSNTCWDYSERTRPVIGFRFGGYSMWSIFYKSTYLFPCIALSISPHTCISPFPLAIVSFRLLSCFSAYVFHPSFLSLQIFHFLSLHNLTEFIVLLFYNFADNRWCFFLSYVRIASLMFLICPCDMRVFFIKRHISAASSFLWYCLSHKSVYQEAFWYCIEGLFLFYLYEWRYAFSPKLFLFFETWQLFVLSVL